MDSRQTGDYVVEPLLSAAAFGLGAMAIYGKDQKFVVNGQEYPLWPFFAAGGAVCTLAVNAWNNYVNDHIGNQFGFASHVGQTLTSVGATAGTMLALESAVGGMDLAGDTMWAVLALAAAAHVGARYIRQNWWDTEQSFRY